MRCLPLFRLTLGSALSCFGTQEPNDDQAPSTTWLVENRSHRHGKKALTRNLTPTASLYRMYEYLVVGYTIGLRSEIEYFFNQPSWAVKDIPDPKDDDAARYAILAGLTHYLVKAFNRLIEMGLPRGSPAIIASRQVEEELRAREVVREQEPGWARSVPRLESTLVIPRGDGEEPGKESRGLRFFDLGIIVDEPHVYFV